MAATVTQIAASQSPFEKAFAGPTKVFDASEEDLGTPNTACEFDTRGVARFTFQAIFANYTGVTVKAQRKVATGTTDNWVDVTSATTSTNKGIVDFAPEAPQVRLSIAGTLSGGADTIEVWAYMDYFRAE